MNDRELLERAAKAAGLDDAQWQDMEGWGEMRYGFESAIWSGQEYAEGGSGYWNPLVDDAQALRLAVKLDMNVFSTDMPGRALAERNDGLIIAGAAHEDDKLKAVRLAIVRAAAAMGDQ